MATGPYTGQYVAAPNAQQYNAYGQEYNYGTNQGYGAANTALSSAPGMISGGNATSNAAQAGLTNAGSTNQTGNLVNNANQIASGFNVPGAVQNAMLSANQEAAQSTLPSLYRGAQAEGNINSDRTAIASGVVQQGLAEQAAGLSASLQNSAYGQGLSSASTEQQQQLSALQAAGTLGNQQAANGFSGLSSGLNDASTASSLATGGANGLNSLQQAIDTNSLDQFNGANNYNWNQLQNYYNVVGGKSWGSNTTGTSTTQTDPSLLQTLGLGSAVLGSLI